MQHSRKGKANFTYYAMDEDKVSVSKWAPYQNTIDISTKRCLSIPF